MEVKYQKGAVIKTKKNGISSITTNNNNYDEFSKCSIKNWQNCALYATEIPKTSEMHFGCDRQIEVERCLSKNRHSKDSVDNKGTKSQLSFQKNSDVNRSIWRKTETGIQQNCYSSWFNRLVIVGVIAMLLIITGLHLWYSKLYYLNKDLDSMKREIRRHISSPDMVLKTYSDLQRRSFVQKDDNLCDNTNEVIKEMKKKMNDIQKGVTMIQQIDVNQNQLGDLLYQHFYGPAADYALEATGGSIIDTPFTKTLSPTGIHLTMFGIPLFWHSSSNARVLIKGQMEPGQCWAFEGKGTVIIRLSVPIKISSITIENFPPHLLPGSDTQLSAPRHFTVTGLSNCDMLKENYDKTHKGIKLGFFEYKSNGPSRQIFQIDKEIFSKMSHTQIVELHFITNHGNPDYTCIYRIRVHGEP